jgi:hypothetical protein
MKTTWSNHEKKSLLEKVEYEIKRFILNSEYSQELLTSQRKSCDSGGSLRV